MKSVRLLTALFCFTMPFSLFAKDPLEPGATAPALTVTTHSGEKLDLGKLYAEGPVLVYFYPKSDTPGCTKQACNIRDNFDALKSEGIEVIGVSSDSVKAQEAFRQKYELPFILVADEDKALGEAFGVGSHMSLMFKRQSFLVVDGKVAWRDLQAKPTSQTEDVLKAMASIQSGQR